jgi:hypothetical protein
MRKMKGILARIFIMLVFLVFSCRDRQPQIEEERSEKDEAISKQTEQSMEKERKLAGPDSTYTERAASEKDSLKPDSVRSKNDSLNN